MTLANFLSIARILLVPVFVALLFSPAPYGNWAAATVFILAIATDAVDGYLARAQKQVTVLGQFLDPLADKVVISAALVSLVVLSRLPAWVAVLIIGRELAVTGLRLVLGRRGRSLPASPLGKMKTVAQAVAVTAFILPVEPAPAWFLMTAALLLTLYSGFAYALELRREALPAAASENAAGGAR